MALTWDLTKVEDFEEVFYHEDEDGNSQMSRVGETAIWMTMFVGIREITEDNYEEFAKRVAVWEKCFDSFWRTQDGSVYFSLDDARSVIGLKTNVNNYTKVQFRARIFEQLYDDATTKIGREKNANLVPTAS